LKELRRESNTGQEIPSSNHRHLSNIDCLMVCTACLVCFICTVYGCSKKYEEA
jgi:hypothetical protein